MKKVIVASQNPVKVNVTKRAFLSVYPDEEFEFVGVQSLSGVPDQPMNDETLAGARNRLLYIQERYPEADFWVSQEGGLFEEGDRLYNQAYIMVGDTAGYVAKAATGLFYLPKTIAEAVRGGTELGHATDSIFNTTNSKQSISTIGYLTDGLIDRENLYLPAAIIVLSEIKHKDWYQ